MPYGGVKAEILSFITSALRGGELSSICAGRITYRVRAAMPIHSVGPGLAVKPVRIFGIEERSVASVGDQTLIDWQSRSLVTLSTEIPRLQPSA
jgi:hypothetical protein